MYEASHARWRACSDNGKESAITTQADPPSEAQQLVNARIAIAQGIVRINELEAWLTTYRAENDKLRTALMDVRRIATRGDVNIQPLLTPILDVIRIALKKEAT